MQHPKWNTGGHSLLPAFFCRFLSMLDTQEAQVMPVICKKHFFGVTVVEACGDFAERPELWILGGPWQATSCTETGTPVVVCAVEFTTLCSPTWLPG